jgi:peroxiredoxin
MISVGDRLPDGELREFVEDERQGCTIGPNVFKVEQIVRGKKIALFGVPGAFTPTCSNKHVPGYRDHASELQSHGVDEIWCLSVNDPHVMGAWGRDQKVGGKIRMMSDGNGSYAKKLGLEVDLAASAMGLRCRRFSMLVEDGVVKQLNVEQPGKFEVSDAATMLKQLR